MAILSAHHPLFFLLTALTVAVGHAHARLNVTPPLANRGASALAGRGQRGFEMWQE